MYQHDPFKRGGTLSSASIITRQILITSHSRERDREMACEPLVLVLLAVALLQPVSAYYPLHMPYTQDNSPSNGELHSCGCRTKIILVGFILKNEDKSL